MEGDSARSLFPCVLHEAGGLLADWNRQVVHGSADSDAMKDLGKPCEGEPHARIDEREQETEHGLGTAAPARKCVDSAGSNGHRACSRLYCWSSSPRAAPM